MLADFLQGRALAKAGHVGVLARLLLTAPGVVGVGDAGDVLVGQLAVGAVHHAAHLPCINKKHFPAAVAELAVLAVAREEPQARGDLGAVEELAGQGDHAVHDVGLDQVLADFAFAGLVRGHGAVGEHETGHARGREVVDDVLHPGEVGVAGGRHAVFPAFVVAQVLAAPVGDVEGRIGEDEVGLEVGVAVVVEGVAVGDLAVDATDGEVHLGQPPGGVVRLLAVDRDVGLHSLGHLAAIAVARGVRADELDGLHEHPRRAAARVVNAAAVGLEHLDQQLDYAARGVKLAAFLALGTGELGEEVFVNAAEHVLGAASLVTDLDVRDEVNDLSEALFVERGACVVFWQNAFEGRIVAFDGRHGLINDPTDVGLPGLRPDTGPTCLGRNPENVFCAVFIGVFGVGALSLLSDKFDAVFLKGVRNVLEEDKTEDDVFVFGGVHRAAQGVGGAPEFCFEVEGRG